MPKFAIMLDEAINGKVQDFYRLYVDGVCEFELFVEGLSPQHYSHLLRAYQTMQQLADGGKLPPGEKWHKFEKIDGLQEAKHRTMRVYFYHHSSGKIIVLGSFQKTKQSKDINEVKRIIKTLPEQIRILDDDDDLQEYISDCKKK